MKKPYLFAMIFTAGVLFAHAARAGAIPGTITYQGTLKESGVPVTGTRTVSFRITNSDGSSVYWSSVGTTVNVNNGLFSTTLSPTGVDWQNVTPYLEVTVGSTILTPREPINAYVYAMMSQSVVDGAITSTKLDSSVSNYLVPQGAIMMFAGPCPNGWTHFLPLDNNFPMGSDTYGVIGGSATHSHNVILSDHTHDISDQSLKIAIGIRNVNYDNNLVMKTGSGVGSFSSVDANQWYSYSGGMSNPATVGTNSANVAVAGPQVSGGTGPAKFSGSNVTDVQSNLPPYISVVYCKKM